MLHYKFHLNNKKCSQGCYRSGRDMKDRCESSHAQISIDSTGPQLYDIIPTLMYSCELCMLGLVLITCAKVIESFNVVSCLHLYSFV